MGERILDLIDAGRAEPPERFRPAADGNRTAQGVSISRPRFGRSATRRHASDRACDLPIHRPAILRTASTAMNSAIRFKLIVMMFLEYVIWGAWFPLLNNYIGPKYLNFDWLQGALVNDAFAIMSLTAIFFGGQLADRYFSQEKFLAFSLLVSGLAMLGLSAVGISAGATGVSNPGAVEAAPALASTFWPFFGLMMLHCFFYVPTMSVTNAIAFANIKDAQKEFGFIRVCGTLGWIAAAVPFFFVPVHHLFTVAGIAALVTAAYCLTLPSTPPVKSEGEAFAPLKAFKLLAVPTILVLFIVTFLDSLVHNCLFLLERSVLLEARPARELDPRRDEHRPDRRDRDHGGPGLLPQAAGLAHDHDPRRPGPCRPVRDLLARRLLRRTALAWARHAQQHRPRFRLCVLLRDGLHLRRRELPQRRPHKRSEPVQSADPGSRAVCRRVPLEGPGERVLDKGGGDDHHRLHDCYSWFPSCLGCSRRRSWRFSSTPSQGAGPRRGSRSCQLSRGRRFFVLVALGPWPAASGALLTRTPRPMPMPSSSGT